MSTVQQAMLEERGPSRLGGRIDTFCSRAILLIFLFILAWGPLAFGGRFSAGFLVIQGATVAALALWMVRFWVQRPFRLLWPPVCWAVLAFLMYALARCRWVEVEYTGRQQWIRVLVYGALFFLALNNLNHKHSATLVSLTLIAVGTALALWAVFQFASDHHPVIWGVPTRDEYKGRGSGTFMNPNHLAGFLGMAVPLALACTVMGKFSSTVRVVLGYCAVVMLGGIAVSVSRGGMVTAAVALVVFCAVLLTQKDFWRPALVLLCLMTALGLGAASQLDSIQKRFDKMFQYDKIGDGRLLYWAGAWQLFQRAPVWGIGPGHFDIEFPSVRPGQVQDRPLYVHNDYLNTLCDWGVIGLGLIAAACGLLGWGVWRVWRSLRKPTHETASRFSERIAFVLGAAIGLMSVMLHCVVEFNMQIAALAATAVTLMALLAAHARFATERYWRNPGRIGKIVLTVLVAAVIGYLSVQGLRKGTETYWLARGNSQNSLETGSGFVDPMLSHWLARFYGQSATAESVLACVLKAHEADPMDWETDSLLGDYLWQFGQQLGPGYLERVRQALDWYAKSMQLNRFDPYAPMGCGMCLDWLGQTQEASPYFRVAIQNDPYNCEVAREVGRHCIALGELKAAKRWLRDGAQRIAGMELAAAEERHLDELMNNPLYVAAANLSRTNQSPKRELEEDDPLLKGPK